jgi:hypothetical protein
MIAALPKGHAQQSAIEERLMIYAAPEKLAIDFRTLLAAAI